MSTLINPQSTSVTVVAVNNVSSKQRKNNVWVSVLRHMSRCNLVMCMPLHLCGDYNPCLVHYPVKTALSKVILYHVVHPKQLSGKEIQFSSCVTQTTHESRVCVCDASKARNKRTRAAVFVRCREKVRPEHYRLTDTRLSTLLSQL